VLENGIGAAGVKCVVRIRQAGGVADPQRHLRAEVRGALACLGGHRFAGIYSRHLVGCDLVVVVEPVQPGVVNRQLPKRWPIHRRGHHE